MFVPLNLRVGFSVVESQVWFVAASWYYESRLLFTFEYTIEYFADVEAWKEGIGVFHNKFKTDLQNICSPAVISLMVSQNTFALRKAFYSVTQ